MINYKFGEITFLKTLNFVPRKSKGTNKVQINA